MLIIIHGSDTTQSRKYFLDEKNKTRDSLLIESENVNVTDLTQLFEGGSLFSESKYLFIEQLLTKRKKSTDLKDILLYLEKQSTEHTIILWEGKELERGALSTFKKATIRDFKLPQTLFQFLDALKPDNNKLLIKLFHQTVTTTEPEMIFFMLVRQFRILLALAQNPSTLYSNDGAEGGRFTPIDELKRMQPWQKNKIEKQSKLFDTVHLLDLYDKLFKIEVGQKTGTLNTSLICAIDFFLLEV
jgi:DNA polymerase III delta subunit